MKIAYRLFVTMVFLATFLETGGLASDPLAVLGTDFHSDLTAVIHIHIIVSIFEILLLLTLGFWLFRGKRAARAAPFQRGSLFVPILVFAGVLLFGVLYGQLRGGATLTEALWEVRGFLIMIAAYFFVGMFVRSDREANQLTWVLLLAPTALALDNVIRGITSATTIEGNDLAYDHVDSVVLGCAMLLCIAIITYGGTLWQRRYAFAALPIMVLAVLLMKRRAAFPVLGIGVIVLVIFLLRLRPRLFWRYVPAIALLVTLYLVAYWNNTGTLGQPARAISSQFTPDPRDAASNLYRDIEKADILANIQQAPITGLGFGQPFTFYYQLPDLSWWQFWHFETHNSVLWVWMKDGLVGFAVFFWLLGQSIYEGSQTVETQREEWALVAELRKRFSRRRRDDDLWADDASSSVHRIMYRATGAPEQRGTRGRKSRGPAIGLNVPVWERSDDRKSVTARRSATLALLVVAVCMIPMELTYSYVDLGLISERNMLLFGLMLGLIAHGRMLLGIQPEEAHRAKGRRKSRTTLRPAPRATVVETGARVLTPAESPALQGAIPGKSHLPPMSSRQAPMRSSRPGGSSAMPTDRGRKPASFRDP